MHASSNSSVQLLVVLKKQTIFADLTNRRAYATVFHLFVCRLWRYVLWLNGAS